MKMSVNLDANLVEQATRLTGIADTSALVKRGLENLISKEKSQRLANLAGSEKYLQPIPRRRSL